MRLQNLNAAAARFLVTSENSPFDEQNQALSF